MLSTSGWIWFGNYLFEEMRQSNRRHKIPGTYDFAALVFNHIIIWMQINSSLNFNWNELYDLESVKSNLFNSRGNFTISCSQCRRGFDSIKLIYLNSANLCDKHNVLIWWLFSVSARFAHIKSQTIVTFFTRCWFCNPKLPRSVPMITVIAVELLQWQLIKR